MDFQADDSLIIHADSSIAVFLYDDKEVITAIFALGMIKKMSSLFPNVSPILFLLLIINYYTNVANISS